MKPNISLMVSISLLQAGAVFGAESNVLKNAHALIREQLKLVKASVFSSQANDPMLITKGAIITESGYYQCSGQDIPGSIIVEANNVVLDLNCSYIEGEIIIDGTENITVANGIAGQGYDFSHEGGLLKNVVLKNVLGFESTSEQDVVKTAERLSFCSLWTFLERNDIAKFKSFVDLLIKNDITFPWFDAFLLVAEYFKRDDAIIYLIERVDAQTDHIVNKKRVIDGLEGIFAVWSARPEWDMFDDIADAESVLDLIRRP